LHLPFSQQAASPQHEAALLSSVTAATAACDERADLRDAQHEEAVSDLANDLVANLPMAKMPADNPKTNAKAMAKTLNFLIFFTPNS
jgi:hypothetical protein